MLNWIGISYVAILTVSVKGLISILPLMNSDVSIFNKEKEQTQHLRLTKYEQQNNMNTIKVH